MSIKENIDEEGNSNIEKNNIGEKTYKLVGYYSKVNDTIESYMDPGFVALSLKQDDDFVLESKLFFKLKNTSELRNTIVELFPEDSQVKTHSNLLRLDGVGLSDNTMNVLYGIAAIIIAMIVFTSVSVIRNSFSISIVEKTKQYGILKSLGATDKQIKKDIYFEAFSLGAIGIALGLLLGFVATKILIFAINSIGKDLMFKSITTFEASFSLIGIALAIGLALLTILLSSMRVARRVKNISAIEAIRGSKDINIKDKDIKTPSYIDSLFGFAGLVSYKNLKRNSKKYCTTLLSLITSVAIFISAFYIVDVLKDSLDLQFQEEAFDIRVFGFDNNNESSYDDLKELSNKLLTNEEFSITKRFNIRIDKKYLNDVKRKAYRDNNLVSEYSRIILLEDKEFDQCLKANNLDSSVKFITTNKVKIELDGKKEVYDSLKNTTFIAKMDNNIANPDTKQIEEIEDKELEISVSIVAKPPFGFERFSYNSLEIFAKESNFNKENLPTNTSSFLYIKTDDPDALEKKIYEYNELNGLVKLNTTNIFAQNRSMQALILILQIFVYGFIIVITLIGITNIFNTITSNMESRKIEFASLKSVGMDSKDFLRMNRLESLFLGSRAYIIGLIIGLLITVLFHLALKNKLEMPYKLPLLGIIISLVFVFALIRLIMSYSSSKLKNINIIETIRNENI